MEETQGQQAIYKLLRFTIYFSILVEFFVYVVTPEEMDAFGGIIADIHTRVSRFYIYQQGHLAYSKLMTALLVVITSLGTKAKKDVNFDSRYQVYWPLAIGFILVVSSVFLYNYKIAPTFYHIYTNVWLYVIFTLIGTPLVHLALDNITKHIIVNP